MGLCLGIARISKQAKDWRLLRTMIEPLLLGIVLGLIPVTLGGLFLAAFLQYKRGNDLGIGG